MFQPKKVKAIHESAFALKPEHQGNIVTIQAQEKDLAEIKALISMFCLSKLVQLVLFYRLNEIYFQT